MVRPLTLPCQGRWSHAGGGGARLKHNPDCSPLVAASFPSQTAILSGPGGGQSDCDEHNTAGGLLFPQFNRRAYPEVFQICQTGRRIGP